MEVADGGELRVGGVALVEVAHGRDELLGSLEQVRRSDIGRVPPRGVAQQVARLPDPPGFGVAVRLGVSGERHVGPGAVERIGDLSGPHLRVLEMTGLDGERAQGAMGRHGQAHQRDARLAREIEHQRPSCDIGLEAQRVVRPDRRVIQKAAHRVVVGEHGEVARHFTPVGQDAQAAQRMLVAERRDHVVAAIGRVHAKAESGSRDVVPRHGVAPRDPGVDPPRGLEAGIDRRRVLVDHPRLGRRRLEAVAALARVERAGRDRSEARRDRRAGRAEIEAMRRCFDERNCQHSDGPHRHRHTSRVQGTGTCSKRTPGLYSEIPERRSA